MNITDVLSYKLFTVGLTIFTVGRLLTIVAISLLFVIGLRVLRKIWMNRISKFEGARRGSAETLSKFAYYLVLTIGLMVVLHANGIDLTALTLLTSALGIGIGFGLQSITNNLISGIIILFERPIKVGDRIEVGGVAGDVVAISIRASTILTNDNISVIVPNSDFITQRVINWSFNNRNVRFHVKVGVAYNSDPKLVKKVLLDVAALHPGVLQAQNADVMFNGFGDNSLEFSLRVWTKDYASRPGVLTSELNFLIFERFKQEGIEIPFPQRDVYIKQIPDKVEIADLQETT